MRKKMRDNLSNPISEDHLDEDNYNYSGFLFPEQDETLYDLEREEEAEKEQ